MLVGWVLFAGWWTSRELGVVPQHVELALLACAGLAFLISTVDL
ncbi:hypothetical protein [Natrarchaeobius oligotrophus]|nr:hypothetical protein [Natrarchaeobius chitinivorans]